MKRKGFKKETSLTLMKGEKEIIDLHKIVYMDVILDGYERLGWVIYSGFRRHIYYSREGFKETGKFRDREMVIILRNVTRFYGKQRVMSP